jgi:hypothetical protein
MANLFGKTAIAMAALSMAAAPALAQSSASALSLRASTKAVKESSITSPPIIAVIGLLAIVGAGIYVAVDDDDSPDSR